MNPSTFRRWGPALIAATILVALAVPPAPAHAEGTAPARSVYATTDALARQLVAVLRDPLVAATPTDDEAANLVG